VEIAGIPRLDRLGLLRVVRRGRRDVAEMQVANCRQCHSRGGRAPLSKAAKHLGMHSDDDIRGPAFLDAAQPGRDARFRESSARSGGDGEIRTVSLIPGCKLAAFLAQVAHNGGAFSGSTRQIIVRGLAGY